MKASHLLVLLFIASAVWASMAALAGDRNARPPTAPTEMRMTQGVPTAPGSAVDSEIPSLEGATEWLNSPPLTPAGLRGSVVLVEFWTYTCINWRREFPYVRAWSEKYKDKGLVVIGVHSPEFEFEKNFANVRRAAIDIGVHHPIAVDSHHAIWRAFRNQYWPALYFVDAKGRIRHRQFGEGDYEQSERVIQQLLTEAGAAGVGTELVSVNATGAEAAADWQNLKSPESYVGYGRAQSFASPGKVAANQGRVYTAPERLARNRWALSGDWTVKEQAVTSNKANGRIVYSFHARDLHLVMGPADRGASIRFRVLLDGKPPGPARGVDVDDQGNGTIGEQRMYQLIRQSSPITDRRFEIEFLDPGAEAFAFTFG